MTAIIKTNGSFVLANESHARVPRQFRGSARLNCHLEFKEYNLFSKCHFEKVMLFQNQFKSNASPFISSKLLKIEDTQLSIDIRKSHLTSRTKVAANFKVGATTSPSNIIASGSGRTNFYLCVSRERWVGLRGCENFSHAYPVVDTTGVRLDGENFSNFIAVSLGRPSLFLEKKRSKVSCGAGVAHLRGCSPQRFCCFGTYEVLYLLLI